MVTSSSPGAVSGEGQSHGAAVKRRVGLSH
jgi:hypothetical protein